MLENSVTSSANGALGILSIMLQNFVPAGTSTSFVRISASVLGLFSAVASSRSKPSER
jgi:hypothetical protein